MKGCDSHKLHLSVVEMAGPEEKTDRNGAVIQHASALQVIISKIDTCMKELRKLTNAAKLRTKTRLRPEKRIRIRWSSLYSMLKKWNRIKRKVSSISDWPEVLLDSIPTQLENARMLEYTGKLAKFESVSKALQKSGDKRLNVYQSRVLLNKIVTVQTMVMSFHSPHSGKTQELCRISTLRMAFLKFREAWRAP